MNRGQVAQQLPALRRYARALTGDAWAADDLVQDTLERACHKWLLWRSGSNLRVSTTIAVTLVSIMVCHWSRSASCAR